MFFRAKLLCHALEMLLDFRKVKNTRLARGSYFFYAFRKSRNISCALTMENHFVFPHYSGTARDGKAETHALFCLTRDKN